MFKSAEEKAREEAERVRREAERAERERLEAERQAREAFLATPVGQATQAKELGQRFLEIQLAVASNRANAVFGAVEARTSEFKPSASVLEEIEQLGWQLEHAGYTYVVTEQTSTEKMFLSGQATAVNGHMVGIYLFRSVDGDRGLDPADDSRP